MLSDFSLIYTLKVVFAIIFLLHFWVFFVLSLFLYLSKLSYPCRNVFLRLDYFGLAVSHFQFLLYEVYLFSLIIVIILIINYFSLSQFPILPSPLIRGRRIHRTSIAHGLILPNCWILFLRQIGRKLTSM